MLRKFQLAFYCLLFCLTSSSAAQSSNDDFQLPNTTKPESYLVIIRTNVPETDTRFEGVVTIVISALENTNEIFLHSSSTVEKVELYDTEKRLLSSSFVNERDDILKITTDEELQAGSAYELLIGFHGNLLSSTEGFYVSSHVEDLNEIDVYTWQAATHFQPFSARHAFPCYDTTKEEHRAAFEVVINHDRRYSVYSSMREDYRIEDIDRDITLFTKTPRISPSSLAFFISGFKNVVRTTSSGVELSVTVREAETDNVELLLDMTTRILETVTSLIGDSLPALHSVVLPEYEKTLGAFYGLNYYREDLILFNPSTSPLVKELAMSNLITNGILSQFIGNVVTFESWDDAWIFKGLSYFLAYQTNSNEELFISEVLHPTLQLQSFSEFPFSADEALSDEVAAKAACTFRMIYYAIEGEAFSQTLQRLIRENSFKSITPATFYEALQSSVEGAIDLRAAIEGFISQRTISVVFVRRYEEKYLRVVRKPIAMPYNVRTPSMDDASEVEWMEGDVSHDIIYVESLRPNDWFLFNVDQFGFYRVNYDDANWRAIIRALHQDLQVFSARTKAQLIDDSLNLAKRELLSYDVAFELLTAFKGEKSPSTWSAAFGNLLSLNNFLVDSTVHDEFQEFVLQQSASYIQDVGFTDDIPGENAADKLSRLHMIDFACRMKSEECLFQMHNKLKSHIDDGAELSVNLESSVFCFGLSASASKGEGLRLFNASFEEMQAAGSREHRLRIIDSLGCYGDVETLTGYLGSILLPKGYMTSEKLKVIQSVYSHTVEGVEATMNFMIDFGSDAVRQTQTSNLIEILVAELPQRIFNEQLLAKFKEMLEKHQVSDELSLPAVETIRNNIAWHESEAARAINNWFEERNKETTTTTTLEPSTTVETTTESSTTDATTLNANSVVFSTILGISCSIIWLLL